MLATADMPSGQDGLLYGGGLHLLYGGGLHLLWVQTVAALAVLAYCIVLTLGIALALRATIGLRVTPEHEEGALDRMIHRKPPYDLV